MPISAVNGRGAEAAGGHQHRLLALIRAMRQRLGPGFDDLDAAIGAEELRGGGREIGGPALPGFDERHPGCRANAAREHQPGERHRRCRDPRRDRGSGPARRSATAAKPRRWTRCGWTGPGPR